MNKQQIRFGFEIGTGKEIKISLAHTVITGLTQAAGKTTEQEIDNLYNHILMEVMK